MCWRLGAFLTNRTQGGRQGVICVVAAWCLVFSGAPRAQVQSNTSNSPPLHISADSIRGQVDVRVRAEGNVELQQGENELRAREIDYTHSDGQTRAQGDVRIKHVSGSYKAERADVKLQANEGVIENTHFDFSPSERVEQVRITEGPRTTIQTNAGFGQAKKLRILDAERSEAQDISYSMCRKNEGPADKQDWFFEAEHLSIDRFQNVGLAKGVRLNFLGQRFPKIPSISFALDDGRKSGWLPPSFGAESRDGFSFGIPYYWNIAPNRDATITPYLRTNRGLDLGGEFRYLEDRYSGEIQANFLPKDRLKSINRWGLNLQHRQQITLGAGLNPIALNLLYQKVSDDDYWKDFSKSLAGLSGRLQNQRATLHFAQNGWTIQAGAQSWQTLQDLSDPNNSIVPPYNRLPFANVRYKYENLKGFDVDVMADVNYFEADKTKTKQANANRWVGAVQVAYPIQTQGWFIKPKLGIQANRYNFDELLPQLSTNRFSNVATAQFIVPTFSLDAGLALERETKLGNQVVRQTLEPRAFYVYSPERQQSGIPSYDTALRDFNFASIFTENAFSGFDRVSDSHTVTLGLTSRFLQEKTGKQILKLNWAQRLRLDNQNVTLPSGVAVKDRLSDQLYGATMNINDQWAFDTTIQFNPDTKRTVRSLVGLRYSPSKFRTVSLAYRLQRNESEQYDFGWQWPLRDLTSVLYKEPDSDSSSKTTDCPGSWYSVGRINYNKKDRKLANALLGLEYDAQCWVGRFVVEQTQLGSNSRNTRYMLQLELVGLSRINLGSNPLTTLKQVIPKYEILHDRP